MSRFSCLAVLFLASSLLAAAQQTAPPPAAGSRGQTSSQPPDQSPIAGTVQPNNDYGAGGHAIMQIDQAGDELVGIVFDPNDNLRHHETPLWSQIGNTKLETELRAMNFDAKGHTVEAWDFKYDLHHNLTFTDITRYGLHGERIGEEITNYRPDGYEIKDWSLGTHNWTSEFTPYKTPPAQGTAAATSPLGVPVESVIDVIFPKAYKPGETVSGSLWPAAYGDNFNGVPGLSVSGFSLPLYHLPDGSPEWSSLKIGVKGDGYLPVDANGRFSLHIPYDWKGPLQLQARQPDPVPGLGSPEALLNIDEPAAAPTLPSNAVPANASTQEQHFAAERLIDLWNEAFDRETKLEEAYNAPEAAAHAEEIADMEYDLDDCYAEIDYVMGLLPQDVVVKLAKELAQDARNEAAYLNSQPNLTADDKDDIEDATGWAKFLDGEAAYASFWEAWTPSQQPLFWTNPILNEGKLGALRGFYENDPLDTQIHIDNFRITPMAATPYVSYFMPPDGLTAGQHNYIIDSPGITETILPVFYMTLTMSADQLQLHKGQHTTYHATLNGANGLPLGAWISPFYPTDLVDPQELSAAKQEAGSARTGFITFDITNQSPGVISMTDVHTKLDASFFAPSGSYTVNGGVGAMKDGSFNILGVARAYLNPEIGLGPPPGAASATSTPPVQTPYGQNWMPSLSWSYNADWAGKSPLLNNCSAEGATPAAPTPASPATPIPTGGSAPASPCMNSTEQTIYDKAIGNQPSIPVGDEQPDLTQLPEAAKRVDEAKKKTNDAFDKSVVASHNLSKLWEAGLDAAPQELKDDLTKAEDPLAKAEAARDKMKQLQLTSPSDDHASFVAAAEQDVADAEKAREAARQKIIDSFTPDQRKAFLDAQEAYRKALADLQAAWNERRAAEEALQKLQAALAK